MPFLKRQLPLLICFVIGVAMALQYYVPTTFSQKFSSQASDWYIIITIFASLLGFGSVMRVHYGRVQRKNAGWGYSVLVFVGFLVMVVFGVVFQGKSTTERPPDEQGNTLAPVDTMDPTGTFVAHRVITTERVIPDLSGKVEDEEAAEQAKPKTYKVLVMEVDYSADGKAVKATETKYDRAGNKLDTREAKIDEFGMLVPYEGHRTQFGYLYDNVLVPLQGTMFAILGFYIASAAFRSFRAKSLEAGLLLVTALIVLIGNVPYTNYVWAEGLGIHHFRGIRFEMPDIVGWLMSTPNTAARRGVGFGVALGVIATSLKIIFGIERAYLGGGD